MNRPPNSLIIGFTGTQEGMNGSQLDRVSEFLLAGFKHTKSLGIRGIFVHGDCVGSDDEAARTARFLGYYVIALPCTIEHKRAYCPDNSEVRIPELPLVRNRKIVDLSDYMIATPKEELGEPEPIRSGTWSTIRYARKQNKYIYIVWR